MIDIVKRYVKIFLKPITERNFTYSAYEKFIINLEEDKRIKVVPLKEFHKIDNDQNKIIVALRHDVDLDINSAIKMAEIEHKHGMQSTYYILHTAIYYGVIKNGLFKRNKRMLPKLKVIQNKYKHEIGWHNDLVTIEIIHKVNPIKFLQEELEWLRENEIEIVGTAAHGSEYCPIYAYHNNYFFKDFYLDINSIKVDNNEITISKGYLKDFGFEYEAYHLDNSHYFSDCSFVEGGGRFHTDMINLEDLKEGDKVIVLTHPCHWGSDIFNKYKFMISLFMSKILSKML